MAYTTLTGADDQPCELVGYGAIPADLAREIAADAVWKRLVTDPLSGALLDHGRSTYRPPAALSEFVRARDVYCRFPPCRCRAIDTELDHTIAFGTAGGDTAETNLYGGCGLHHHLKHDAAGWTVTQEPNGRITWTTPTGHRYSSDPYDYRPGTDPVDDPGPADDRGPPRQTPAPAPTGTRIRPPADLDRGAHPAPAGIDEDEPPF